MDEASSGRRQPLRGDAESELPEDGAEGIQDICARGGDHRAAELKALQIAIQIKSFEIIQNFPERVLILGEINGYISLHTAAIMGHIRIADNLLKRGADVREKSHGGVEPLDCAVSSTWIDDDSRLNMVRLLLSYRADPNCQDDDGNTALHSAASVGGERILEELLENGGELQTRDRRGRGLLHFARDEATVHFLLDRGVNVEERDELGRVSLHSAAELNHLSAVESLMSSYDWEIRDNDGMTALHLAAGRGNESIVDLLAPLFATNKRIDVVDNHGWTALILSAALVQTNRVGECDKWYRKYYANPKYYELREEMEEKIYSIDEEAGDRHLSTAARLLKAGADPNKSDCEGCHPIHWAVYSGVPEMVELLLAHGAEVDKRDGNGRTALHLAVGWHCVTITMVLLAHGANPSALDNAKLSPLTYVFLITFKWSAEQFETLLAEKGEDSDYNRVKPPMVFHTKVKDASFKLAQLLLEAGTNPDISDSKGKTPLHFAAEMGWYESVRLLLKHKAHFDHKDCGGWTALEVAGQRYESELRKIIVDSFLMHKLQITISILLDKVNNPNV